MTGVQQLDQRTFLDVNGLRFFLATVDDGGNTTFAAQGTGGSLACPFALFGRQVKLIAHNPRPLYKA